MKQLSTLLLAALLSSLPAAAQEPTCTGQRVTVLPLFPVATSPGVARAEEERMREELSKDVNLCVQSRAQTLTKLGPASAIACEDAQCRKRLAERVGADWVVFGMVFGFGGRTTMTAQAWDATGERLSRRTFEASAPNIGNTLIIGARALPMSSLPAQASVRGRAMPLALAGAGLIALAAGAAFGVSSLEASRALSQPQTGCNGTGADYTGCLDDRATLGRRQAVAANVFYGAAVVMGVSATVFWVMEWP